MEKIFLSYKFSGENPVVLEEMLTRISTIIKSKGYDVFCSFYLEDFFRQQRYSAEDIYRYCLDEQEACTTIIGFVNAKERSEGMEREFCKAKELGQKYILLIREGLDFAHFRRAADKITSYGNLAELYSKLEEEI